MNSNKHKDIEVLYKNEEHCMTLTEAVLSVGDYTVGLKNIAAVFKVSKKKSAWPGVVLFIWGALIFYNDSMTATVGVEPNNPLFKFVILISGIGWFVYRSKSKGFDVVITSNGGDVVIANTDQEVVADDIASNIRKYL